jgi:hypothetical protein
MNKNKSKFFVLPGSSVMKFIAAPTCEIPVSSEASPYPKPETCICVYEPLGTVIRYTWSVLMISALIRLMNVVMRVVRPIIYY